MEIGIFAAFLAGIISFLSPCVLPLVPPYLAYLGGTTLDQISGERDEIDPDAARRVFVSAVFFVLGLATVFVMLGMGASFIGQALVRYKAEFGLVAGGVIFALGLHFFGLRRSVFVGAVVCAALWALGGYDRPSFSVAGLVSMPVLVIAGVALLMQTLGHVWQADQIPLLQREARFEGPQQAGSYGASYVIGLAFAFGWTPCIGPILGAILSLAAQEETLTSGTLLLMVYALGLGVPFLIAALFIRPFLNWARGFRRHLSLVEKIMGILLIVVGAMMVSGDFERLAYFLLEMFPILATIG
jgi:cytochrome c-type biogenesis protein